MNDDTATSRRLDEVLARIERDHLVEIRLADLAHLMVEPDIDPFAPLVGPAQSGIDDLVATLSAARALPDDLTVRVVLPAGTQPAVATSVAQEAMRSRAAYQASVTWRDAMAVRSMGRRQFPIGIAISVVSALVAYAAGDRAASASGVAAAVLAVVAGIAITVAWVVSWIVVETAFIDWRTSSRGAAVYELLARSTLEVTTEPAGSRSS